MRGVPGGSRGRSPGRPGQRERRIHGGAVGGDAVGERDEPIEQFDFRLRQLVLRYLDPTFVEQARSLALIGAPGLGKTMLAICSATKHVQLGASACFITAQQLANQLGRATTSLGRQRVLRPIGAKLQDLRGGPAGAPADRT